MMLRFALLLASVSVVAAWAPTSCGTANLTTQWTSLVNPSSVLPEYPRPQLQRADSTWKNLNGLWQFEPGASGQAPPFGRTLNSTILVPFPVESCLSGVGATYKYLWYRLVFDSPTAFSQATTLLHFGAVDWQTTVWVNQHQFPVHTGGYDGFSFDISSALSSTNNELLVFVYDPSDDGYQPNGKQRISAITSPGGDTYTPSSGIWQTVWLENVPATYVANLTLLADTRTLTLTVSTEPSTNQSFVASVFDGTTLVTKIQGFSGTAVKVPIPNPKLWDPLSPFLYNLSVALTSNSDSVDSYFGMRSITLGRELHPGTPDTGPQAGIDRGGEDMPGYPVVLPSPDPNLCWQKCQNTTGCEAWAYAVPGCDSYSQPMCWLKSGVPGTSDNKCRVSGALAEPASVVVRPYLNGGFVFMAGWLDQSWWPDGLYTAPTDDALLFDLAAIKTFGLNTVRLHQKVNSERWYYHADRLGIIVLQDMIQKYGGATSDTIAPFVADLQAMIRGRYNHPSIVQWNVFNEYDCVGVFPDVPAILDIVRNLDPSRLMNTNSGGPANDLHLADVNDLHTYPYPGDPIPSITQYGMLGEFGGVGAFVKGHEWVPGQCTTYLQVDTPADEANTYIQMAQTIQSRKNDISCSIYTQITDVERECDGFYNFDRTNKFTDDQTQAIANANQALIYG